MSARRLAYTAMMVVWALLASTSLPGCGEIPSDSRPQAIEDSMLNEALLPPAPEVTRSPIQFDQAAFSIYLIAKGDDGDQLVEVSRDLSVRATVADVVESLLMGPTDEEAEERLASALPSELEIIGVEGPTGGTVVINVVGGVLEGLAPEEQRIAVAQLVFTLTALNQTSSIRLQVDGVDTPLPKDGDDSAPEEPVARSDYNSVAPDE